MGFAALCVEKYREGPELFHRLKLKISTNMSGLDQQDCGSALTPGHLTVSALLTYSLTAGKQRPALSPLAHDSLV